MSYNKPEKDFGDGPKIHKIRITLTSRNVKSLEKVCQELIDRSKGKELRGPYTKSRRKAS
jgi:small subunit ribosomal protein S20e